MATQQKQYSLSDLVDGDDEKRPKLPPARQERALMDSLRARGVNLPKILRVGGNMDEAFANYQRYDTHYGVWESLDEAGGGPKNERIKLSDGRFDFWKSASDDRPLAQSSRKDSALALAHELGHKIQFDMDMANNLGSRQRLQENADSLGYSLLQVFGLTQPRSGFDRVNKQVKAWLDQFGK